MLRHQRAVRLDLETVDTAQLPADLPPGGYELEIRWDFEESSQVWQSCSDVTIEARGSPQIFRGEGFT